MKNNLKHIIFLMAMSLVATGCNKPGKEEQGDDEPEPEITFCSYLNTADIGKTIPFVDEFLSGLSRSLDDEQQLQALASWLKSQPCTDDATVKCQSCIKTDPPKSEIIISFDEDGETREFILVIAMTQPLQAAGYHEYETPPEDFCMFLNVKDIDKTIPFIDDFLAGLSTNLDDEQQLQALAAWLTSKPCTIDASVFCHLCTDAAPPVGKILISFDEDGETREFILVIAMTQPLQVAGYYEYETLPEEFCTFLNVKDIGKTIPFIDDFLERLSTNLDDEQQLQALIAWLTSQPCMINASVFCHLCTDTAQPMSEILISFDEDGETKKFILEIVMTKPMQAAVYRKYEEPEEPTCLCGDDWPQEELTCHQELAWDYPVKPGTEKWKNMGSLQIIAANQIPDDILSTLSTEDLTKICLQWPLLMFNGERTNMVLDRIFLEFNGFRELFQREDVSQALLNHYQCKMQNIYIVIDPDKTPYERGAYITSIEDLEIIISRYQSQDETKENYMAILENLVCGYEKKLTCQNKFTSQGSNFFSRAHIIAKIRPESIDEFPRLGYALWSEIMSPLASDIINELSYQLIKQYHEK